VFETFYSPYHFSWPGILHVFPFRVIVVGRTTHACEFAAHTSSRQQRGLITTCGGTFQSLQLNSAPNGSTATIPDKEMRMDSYLDIDTYPSIHLYPSARLEIWICIDVIHIQNQNRMAAMIG
jgi:hypothetical protein